MEQISDIAKRIKPGMLSDNQQWASEPTQRQRHGERVTLDTLDTSSAKMAQAVDMCKAWARAKREGIRDISLVFVGPVGTGKTHLAKAVLWSICLGFDDGTPVAPVGRFYRADELVQAYEPGVASYALIPQNCPILVIDDVGAEQVIPFISAEGQDRERQHRYFGIIDRCYRWEISVVITSNLSLDSLSDVMGHRAWSRLGEMAPAGFMIDLSGVSDYRRKRAGR
jgi:DNA replication protein DnaC